MDVDEVDVLMIARSKAVAHGGYADAGSPRTPSNDGAADKEFWCPGNHCDDISISFTPS